MGREGSSQPNETRPLEFLKSGEFSGKGHALKENLAGRVGDKEKKGTQGKGTASAQRIKVLVREKLSPPPIAGSKWTKR